MVFIIIQRKSINGMLAQICDRTEKPVVLGFWKKTQTNGFHYFFCCFYFVAVGSFTTDGGLLQPMECAKTQNPFS